jgi:hypothetical protein
MFILSGLQSCDSLRRLPPAQIVVRRSAEIVCLDVGALPKFGGFASQHATPVLEHHRVIGKTQRDR